MPFVINRARAVAALVLLSSTTVGSCATTGSRSVADCDPGQLMTVTPSTLTLSTGAATRAPWVNGGDLLAGTSGDPNDGEGYDAAVGFALAERLGYAREDVTWVATPFADAISAGTKQFDVNINQATITADRRADVDLSVPYYTVRQVIISNGNKQVEQARSLADLNGVTLSVLAGSEGERLLPHVDTGATVLPYGGIEEAIGAVGNLRADGLVLDLPQAAALADSDQRLLDGDIIASLPRSDGPVESYGMVLAKDSPLTSCVDATLSAMREDGTLDSLERTWLMDEPGWPELQ